MAEPEEEIWVKCHQMHKGVRLRDPKVLPGSYQEESGKG